MKELIVNLKDRLAGLIIAMGYELVGVELKRQGRGSLLRIYIDSPQGITVDDCSRVSRQVSALLDVEDPIQGQYDLEVSSPGLNRPLFELEHYKKYIGNEIRVRLRQPVNERRNYVGELIDVESDKICLLVGEEKVTLFFSDIEKANLIAKL